MLRRRQSVSVSPPRGSRIKVWTDGARTVFRWPTSHRDNWVVTGLLWLLPPVGLFLTLLLLHPGDRSLVLDRDAIEFATGTGARHRVPLHELGEVHAQGSLSGHFLTVDQGTTRHLVATGDFLPALDAEELEWLAEQIETWKQGDAA